MKIIILLVSGGVIFVCGMFAGSKVPFRYFVNQSYGSDELKVCVQNLQNEELDPELREYLKARVYVLVNSGVKPEWVDSNIDFGPVDESVLDLGVGKTNPSVSVYKSGEGLEPDYYQKAMSTIK